ncbi:multidrug transporter [Thermosipho affectus]|uniref:Multidrug transporter n=1 Tax=Thermosipho affectus TaxID=660294 RepID=A0ABX3IH26_9BACT|nr:MULTISPECIES: multidrug transporter [Thermosipho]ANQ53773.1 hypothetical protein Y592_04950 [Thermosipho sp. 1070]APT72219.1 multidrug transporter [Thermosipho sp. 1063]ONN27125.1 multidrug transporter [Thermosipho affectus]OOC43463.1 multidrug transporter [Thermosipho sp. 1074]
MSKKSSIVAKGVTLIGIGVGFILLKYSPYYFVASIMIGIGAGFLIGAILDRDN